MASPKIVVSALLIVVILSVTGAFAIPHVTYTGFAQPEQSYSLSTRNLTFATTSSAATLSLSATDSAVYRYAYASLDGGNWTAFPLSGGAFGGEWLNGTVTGQLPLTAANFSLSSPGTSARRNFIIIYSCLRNATGWDCHGGWQIWQLNASLAGQCTPDCGARSCGPAPNGCGTPTQCGTCGTGYTCNATGQCVTDAGTWSGELMTNGGFETGSLTGWTAVGSTWAAGTHPAGTDGATGGLNPQAGSYAAYATTTSSSGYMYQDVDLTAYASSIDAGGALVNASGWGVSVEPGYDNTRIQVIFLNAAKAVISTPFNSGYLTGGSWSKRGIYNYPIPANTRYVRMWGNTYEEGYDSGSLDSFSVRVKAGACTDTCASLGYDCDSVCGVSCGTCSGSATCVSGHCTACTPTTCVTLGYNCGSWPDGCGGTLNCGTCSGSATCVSGHCTACTDTCSSLGYQCGTQTVCGASVDCGTCGTGYTCSGGTCVPTGSCGGITCGTGEYCSNGVCLLQVTGNTYFVATGGDDDGPGTFDDPWATWQKAFNTADAGDIVYFRGGVWYPAQSLIIAPRTVPGEYEGDIYGNSGTAANPIRYFNYPGETPIIDGSNHISENYPTVIFMFLAEHIQFRGITVRNLRQTPTSYMAIGIGGSCCSNFKFENMNVHDIGGRGYSWMACNGYYGIEDDTTSWINCDTYNCYDPYSLDPGNGGDGWKVQNEAGAHTIFQGCRAWNCSDDGFDPSGSNAVIINNSWSFNNGFQGALDGNGFKSGGVTVAVSYPTRVITNCIAADNYGYGYFDLEYPDYRRNNARVYNNLFYRCNIGIQISNNAAYPSSSSIYRNNIIHEPTSVDAAGRPYMVDAYCPYTESNNNWDYDPTSGTGWWKYATDVTVTDSDFVSLDVSQLLRPRKADGSLPDITFGHLAAGSDLIDAGADVGIPYTGAAPDLGPFEYP